MSSGGSSGGGINQGGYWGGSTPSGGGIPPSGGGINQGGYWGSEINQGGYWGGSTPSGGGIPPSGGGINQGGYWGGSTPSGGGIPPSGGGINQGGYWGGSTLPKGTPSEIKDFGHMVQSGKLKGYTVYGNPMVSPNAYMVSPTGKTYSPSQTKSMVNSIQPSIISQIEKEEKARISKERAKQYFSLVTEFQEKDTFGFTGKSTSKYVLWTDSYELDQSKLAGTSITVDPFTGEQVVHTMLSQGSKAMVENSWQMVKEGKADFGWFSHNFGQYLSRNPESYIPTAKMLKEQYVDKTLEPGWFEQTFVQTRIDSETKQQVIVLDGIEYALRNLPDNKDTETIIKNYNKEFGRSLLTPSETKGLSNLGMTQNQIDATQMAQIAFDEAKGLKGSTKTKEELDIKIKDVAERKEKSGFFDKDVVDAILKTLGLAKPVSAEEPKNAQIIGVGWTVSQLDEFKYINKITFDEQFDEKSFTLPKDKIIFIQVGFRGCPACEDQIASIRKVQNEFGNNVVFVYVSNTAKVPALSGIVGRYGQFPTNIIVDTSKIDSATGLPAVVYQAHPGSWLPDMFTDKMPAYVEGLTPTVAPPPVVSLPETVKLPEEVAIPKIEGSKSIVDRIREAWEGITPWSEQDKETFGSYISKIVEEKKNVVFAPKVVSPPQKPVVSQDGVITTKYNNTSFEGLSDTFREDTSKGKITLEIQGIPGKPEMADIYTMDSKTGIMDYKIYRDYDNPDKSIEGKTALHWMDDKHTMVGMCTTGCLYWDANDPEGKALIQIARKYNTPIMTSEQYDKWEASQKPVAITPPAEAVVPPTKKAPAEVKIVLPAVVSNFDEAWKNLEPFRQKDESQAWKMHDIIGAIKAGIPDKDIISVYGKQVLDNFRQSLGMSLSQESDVNPLGDYAILAEQETRGIGIISPEGKVVTTGYVYDLNGYCYDQRETGRNPESIKNELITRGFKGNDVEPYISKLIPAGLATDKEFGDMSNEQYQVYRETHPNDLRVSIATLEIGELGRETVDIQMVSEKPDLTYPEAYRIDSRIKIAEQKEIAKGNPLKNDDKRRIALSEDLVIKQERMMQVVGKFKESKVLDTGTKEVPEWEKGYDFLAQKIATATGDVAAFNIERAMNDWLKSRQDDYANQLMSQGVSATDARQRAIKAYPSFEEATGFTKGAIKATAMLLGMVKFVAGDLPLTLVNTEMALSRGENTRAVADLAVTAGSVVGMPVLVSGEVGGMVGEHKYAEAIGEVAGLGLTFIAPAAIKGLPSAMKRGGLETKSLFGVDINPRALNEVIDIPITKLPEIFKGKETDVEAILKSGASPEAQRVQLRVLLNPETAKVFDATLELLDDIGKFHAPPEQIGTVDFSIVNGIPAEANPELVAWAKRWSKEIEIRGSFADSVQMNGVKGMYKANDVDMVLEKGMNTTPDSLASAVESILKEYVGEDRVRARGGKVEVKLDGEWVKKFDIHYKGTFPLSETPPLGLTKIETPIMIDGIRFEPVGNQLWHRGLEILRPGEREARGLMGPEATRTEFKNRIKDTYRFKVLVENIIDVLRKDGKEDLANKVSMNLDTLLKAERGEPITAEEEATLESEFLQLFQEMKSASLFTGMDMVAIHPAGTLMHYSSPAAKVFKGGILYSGVRDLRPFTRAMERGEPNVIGKMIDEKGNWVDAPKEFYTSDVAAFDRMADLAGGEAKIGPDAGIVAIYVSPYEVGFGKAFRPVNRFEVITEPKVIEVKIGDKTYSPKGYQDVKVVLDEFVGQEGTRLLATEPTTTKGYAKGLTGELKTWHPRSLKEYPILYLATEGAKELGVKAPTRAQVMAMNLLSKKAAIADLLHPHLVKHIRFTTETSDIGRGKLLNFYKESTKWTPKAKLGKVYQQIADEFLGKDWLRLTKEQVANKIAKEYGFDPVDVKTLLSDELFPIQAFYDPSTNQVGLRLTQTQAELSEIATILHELAHRELDKSSNYLKARGTFGDEYSVAAEAFDELAAIEYVKKKSGYFAKEYYETFAPLEESLEPSFMAEIEKLHPGLLKSEYERGVIAETAKKYIDSLGDIKGKPLNQVLAELSQESAKKISKPMSMAEFKTDVAYMEDSIVSGEIIHAQREAITQMVHKMESRVEEPIIHRGTDPEAIKVAEQYGLSFDGVQEGYGDIPKQYTFTIQRGEPQIKGATFLVEKLSDVPTKLSEKMKEFGIPEVAPKVGEVKPHMRVESLEDAYKQEYESFIKDVKDTGLEDIVDKPSSRKYIEDEYVVNLNELGKSLALHALWPRVVDSELPVVGSWLEEPAVPILPSATLGIVTPPISPPSVATPPSILTEPVVTTPIIAPVTPTMPTMPITPLTTPPTTPITTPVTTPVATPVTTPTTTPTTTPIITTTTITPSPKPIIPLPKFTAEDIAKRGVPPGTVCWRQGFIFRHWFPPYGPDDWLFTRKPVAGVPYAKGVGSAFASITALGGFAPTDAQGKPRTLEYDMGLHKLKIVPNEKGKDPGIHFTLDREDASWSPEHVAERKAEQELTPVPSKPKLPEPIKTATVEIPQPAPQEEPETAVAVPVASQASTVQPVQKAQPITREEITRPPSGGLLSEIYTDWDKSGRSVEDAFEAWDKKMNVRVPPSEEEVLNTEEEIQEVAEEPRQLPQIVFEGGEYPEQIPPQIAKITKHKKPTSLEAMMGTIK
jgi:hypothetical protein